MPIWSMVPTAAWRAIESARSWSRFLPGMSRCDARRRGKPKRPGQQWPRRGMCAYSAASRCQCFNEGLVSTATPTILGWHSDVHNLLALQCPRKNRLTASTSRSIMKDGGQDDAESREPPARLADAPGARIGWGSFALHPGIGSTSSMWVEVDTALHATSRMRHGVPTSASARMEGNGLCWVCLLPLENSGGEPCR